MKLWSDCDLVSALFLLDFVCLSGTFQIVNAVAVAASVQLRQSWQLCENLQFIHNLLLLLWQFLQFQMNYGGDLQQTWRRKNEKMQSGLERNKFYDFSSRADLVWFDFNQLPSNKLHFLLKQFQISAERNNNNSSNNNSYIRQIQRYGFVSWKFAPEVVRWAGVPEICIEQQNNNTV